MTSKNKYPSIIIFTPNGGYCVYYPSNLFGNARSFENWGIYKQQPPFGERRGTDNIQGLISEHIFTPNGGYCLYYPSNLLRNARSFENWEISWGIFTHVTRLDQSGRERTGNI